MIDQLVSQIETRFRELSDQMSDPDVISDRERYAEVGRAYSQLEPAHELAREYRQAADDAAGARELLAEDGDDPELRELLSTSEARLAELDEEIRLAMVEREPETESQGRIHTSTATVAVLPEAEEVDVQIDQNDLQIDVYRSSGPGGQSVNTTDSAVRITHKPSGIVVSMQDEKSQLQNRDKAMRVLRARLYEQELERQRAEIAADRRAQVGTGERSEKIRTYNFPQGRVTDHRVKVTSHDLEGVLAGSLDEFTESLAAEEKRARLE